MTGLVAQASKALGFTSVLMYSTHLSWLKHITATSSTVVWGEGRGEQGGNRETLRLLMLGSDWARARPGVCPQRHCARRQPSAGRSAALSSLLKATFKKKTVWSVPCAVSCAVCAALCSIPHLISWARAAQDSKSLFFSFFLGSGVYAQHFESVMLWIFIWNGLRAEVYTVITPERIEASVGWSV